MFRRPLALALAFSLPLAACAPQADRVASATAPAREKPVWAFEGSDIPVDPAYRFGRLPNGLRYAIRQNSRPAGTALVRMEVAAGSLDEAEHERGFAHFVEHMAFNGSTNVPEGEMVKLLERNGLAFGADTNAQTGFDRTTYLLDLPRNDPALLDTALMLMRETASELTISPEAVARERGVVLAEMRDRNTFALRNLEDQLAFLHPDALYTRRLPIGTPETLNAATAESLRAFWRREYVPAQTTVIVVGDFAPEQVEQAIMARFSGWQGAPAEAQPPSGPIAFADKARADVYIDPALSERIAAARHGPWQEEPDSVAMRQQHLLRQIGYAIVNRRLQRISRTANPPFRDAGFGTADVFHDARTTNLIVDTVDGKWQRGLSAAALEYRRALKFGFTEAEVAEQVAIIRTAARNEAASADTRHNATLLNALFTLIRDERVPSTPQSVLERLEAFVPEITPGRVLEALKYEALPLKKPLLRLQGRVAPDGGASALMSTWKQAMRAKVSPPAASDTARFAYTDFGPTGAVTKDTREAALAIRQVAFANGVRLNLKRTDLVKDRVIVQVAVDGGHRLATRDNPLATEMVSMLAVGGLGQHSEDELQSLLAGRTVSNRIAATPESFVSAAQTTPADLELQLQVMAAQIADPGYRPEGEVKYRLNINNFFAQLRATPASALRNAIGGILSDNDPRFTLQAPEAYRALTFAKLKSDLAGQLANGAIEIGVVGDIDEEAVIALVARTFGALPPREPDFRTWADQRQRPFTTDTTPRTLRHTGQADQALIQIVWKTRDDADPVDAAALQLLERVVRIELTDELRERLGKAYSPGASSSLSRSWDGYGTFSVSASVDVHEVAATRAAIGRTIAALRAAPITADELQRARQPLLEAIDNALKSNEGWMALVDRAQSEADRIERHVKARERLLALTPALLQATARCYLTEKGSVEITVLPEEAPPAAAR